MEFKGFKINIIVLVLVIVVGLFFSGQYILKVYNIDKPVKKEILAVDGVNSVSIIDNKDNNQIDLMVEFAPGINFYDSYQTVEKIMHNRLGSKSGEIIIANNKVAHTDSKLKSGNNEDITEIDKNNSELDNVFYKMQFALFEGIKTGHFVKMEETVDSLAEELNLDGHRMWVDNNALYLQLDKDNKSLYRRIPMNNMINKEGGGSIG